MKKSESAHRPPEGLGERLRQFRAVTQPPLTQARLAERAGLSPAYVSELESGTATRPSGQVLLALAKALGVTIADLLDAAPEPPVSEISASLRDFAAERRLIEADMTMLASIRFRGEPPRTVRRWAMIYDAIRASRTIDDEE